MWLGFRFTSARPRPTFCRNPECSDLVPVRRALPRWELCPSCRLAYTRGALVAGAIGFLVTLVAKLLG